MNPHSFSRDCPISLSQESHISHPTMKRSRCCAIIENGERCGNKVGGGGWDDFGLCRHHRKTNPIARCDQGLIDWASHIGKLKLSLLNTYFSVSPQENLTLPIAIYGIIYSFVEDYSKNIGADALGTYSPLQTTRFDFPIWRHDSDQSVFLFRRPGTHLCLGDLMDLNCDEEGMGYLDEETEPFDFDTISQRTWRSCPRIRNKPFYSLLTLQRVEK